jgi:hypothetical protein
MPASSRLRPAVRGRRPAARRTCSQVPSWVSPSGVLKIATTPSPPRARCSRVWSGWRSSSLQRMSRAAARTAGSVRGPRAPRWPRMVVRRPRRWIAWPSSRPMTPAPTTSRLSGRSSRSKMPSLVRMRSWSSRYCGGRTGDGAGGDDEAAEPDAGLVVDREDVGRDEGGCPEDQVAGLLEGAAVVEDERDEPVALALDAVHDLAAVDAGGAAEDAEVDGLADALGGLGGGDQQLRGHAADARAGGAERAAVDQQGAGAGLRGGAAGGETGCAGADDGDVDVERVHGAVLWVRWLVGRSTVRPRWTAGRSPMVSSQADRRGSAAKSRPSCRATRSHGKLAMSAIE